jgi:hypothetical protein
MIAPFIVFWAVVVITLSWLLTKIISWATLAKGSLLIVMVALVGVVARNVNQHYVDNWNYP